MTRQPATLPEHVLDRLRDGNRRFSSGTANRFSEEETEHRRRLASGQAPGAAVLTCADSRVPPTLIFDQGLGDLFVARVAGHVVTPEQLGSIEYAVDVLGTRLVIVLGHTGCGAVTTAVDLLAEPNPGLSPNIRSITERIRPSVERAARDLMGSADPSALAALEGQARADLLARAIRLNVLDATEALRARSSLLDRLAEKGDLSIVGGEYCLETGTVDFLD